jgi:ABC-type nickel/cobalt efflux system permease component RcnA
MNLKSYKPAADKRVLIFMAGLMWCAAGIMLIRYAVSWLALCKGNEQVFYYSAGFLAAMPIHHFGFLKIADKNLNRLLPLTEKQNPFSFMAPKSYLIVIIMISMGIALRHSQIPKRYLSLLYNGIGLALFLSGIRYLRIFFQLVLSKKD